MITKTIEKETVTFYCYQDEFDNIGLSYVNKNDQEKYGHPWKHFTHDEIEDKVFSKFPF